MNKKLILGAALAVVYAGPVFAEAKIYPYASSANYCPAGMQPISISGVICCGVPNQKMSYQQAMASPARNRVVRKRMARRVATPVYCAEGEKGCYSQ